VEWIPRLRAGAKGLSELNSRQWVSGLVISPFGTRVGIRVEQSALLEKLRSRLLPGWAEEHCEIVDFLWSFTADGRLFYGHEFISGEFLEEFDRRFHIYLGATSATHTFLHAGVVAVNGCGILLPGYSHSGKTSLTQALVLKGATFYSDDLAVIDGAGRVFPYPKPLTIRTKSNGSYKKAAPMGTATLPSAVVSLVCFLHYKKGRKTLLRSVPQGAASLLLIQNCLSVREFPSRDIQRISQVCHTARFYRGIRGSADTAADEILNLLA